MAEDSRVYRVGGGQEGTTITPSPLMKNLREPNRRFSWAHPVHFYLNKLTLPCKVAPNGK